MSTPFRLQVPRKIAAALVVQAQAELPNECCGLLAGTVIDRPDGPIGHVQSHYALVNAAASPIEFESEPRSMFKAVRAMQALGLDILAVYHSHPLSPARPSRIDLARNYSPDVMNLIISLMAADPELRCWWLSEDGIDEGVWELIDD